MRINKQTISLGLCIISIIGVGSTSYLSIKGYEKAKTKATQKEKRKCYIPAIISGIMTSCCIFGAHRIPAKELATVTAAASAITASNTQLQDTLKKVVGEDKAKELTRESIALPKERSIESTGHGSLLCFESYSGRLFYSSMNAVLEAEKKLTRRYLNGYPISMNDFYDLLGIAKTSYGEQWGWVPELDIYHPDYIDDNPLCFDDYLAEDDETGKPLYVIALFNFPLNNWMEEVRD